MLTIIYMHASEQMKRVDKVPDGDQGVSVVCTGTISKIFPPPELDMSDTRPPSKTTSTPNEGCDTLALEPTGVRTVPDLKRTYTSHKLPTFC